MSQHNDDPYEAPEISAMHVEGDGLSLEAALPDEDVDRTEQSGREAEDTEDTDIDVADGQATHQDLAMVEEELEDQGEIPVADQQFGP